MFTPQLLVLHALLASPAFAAPAASNSILPSAPYSAPYSNAIPSYTSSNPLGTPTFTAVPEFQTVQPASDDPNNPAFVQETSSYDPEPTRGAQGGTIISPDDTGLDLQNPDMLAPPTTDHGHVGFAKWPFSLSSNRLQTGGWARQQNLNVMPFAKSMASVNMRLEVGAIRELHWHATAEWAYVLSGSTIITVVDSDGHSFSDTVDAGDLWYFPPGVPHSIQATDADSRGSEFILVFDNGDFDEDDTFLLTDWTAHIPMEILAKNFQTDISAFDHIPSKELYIFPASPPPKNTMPPAGPEGKSKFAYSYRLSQAPATPLSGGSIKVFDTSVFPIATEIVGALVTVEPGAMRELHWHPTEPEWSYFLTGTARMTLYAASSHAQTFDYMPGDIGYVPPSFGHYVENTGNTTMVFLELFNSDKVEDISLSQWLALTPPALVKAHLGVSDEFIATLNTTKQIVVGSKKQ